MKQEEHGCEEEATEIAFDGEDVLGDNPVAVPLIRLLLVANLGHDFLVFDLNVGVVCRQLSHLGEIDKPLLRLPVVD